MKLGSSEDRMKIAAVAVFAVLAAGIVYFEYFYTGTPAAPPPAPAAVTAPAVVGGSAIAAEPVAAAAEGRAAKTVGRTSAALDPSLHMDAMLVSESAEYSGSGRNIFSPNSAPPVVIPKPIAQARLQPVVHPGPPVQTGPPPPPPIDLKFFGFEMSASGQRQAFLLHNDSVYLASAGDVVMRRYRVLAIDARTIRVVDLQNNNTQTLPLLAN
jgi:hypothetical protein